jgi:hypothetical protein
MGVTDAVTDMSPVLDSEGSGIVSLALTEMPVVAGIGVGKPVGGGRLEDPVPRTELVDPVGPRIVGVELERGDELVLLSTLPLTLSVPRIEMEALVTLPLILVTELVPVKVSDEVGVVKPDVGTPDVPLILVGTVRMPVPSVELAIVGRGRILPLRVITVKLTSPEASTEAVELGPAVVFVKG